MIEIIKSDIFDVDADVLAHQVNCRGAMGAGLAKQVRAIFPEAYTRYMGMCITYKLRPEKLLGTCQFVHLADIDEEDIFSRRFNYKVVANCFAQLNYGTTQKQTDSNAFHLCMEKLAAFRINSKPVTIAIPYNMGCGLAGGNWNSEIYPIIKKVFENSENTLLICEK